MCRAWGGLASQLSWYSFERSLISPEKSHKLLLNNAGNAHLWPGTTQRSSGSAGDKLFRHLWLESKLMPSQETETWSEHSNSPLQRRHSFREEPNRLTGSRRGLGSSPRGPFSSYYYSLWSNYQQITIYWWEHSARLCVTITRGSLTLNVGKKSGKLQKKTQQTWWFPCPKTIIRDHLLHEFRWSGADALVIFVE